MFVQVIKAHTTDADAVKAAMDAWVSDLSSGAEGWLGSTGGVTEDGTFLGLARFESEELAQRNSDRPEQGAWWDRVSRSLSDVSFKNSTYVLPDLVGNPDEARFVQIMQGSSNNPERARELMSSHGAEWAAHRPDILGTMMIEHDGGDWTMAIYCTTEAEARVGEKKEPPPEIKAEMDELMSLSNGEPSFFDLKDPWLRSR